MFQIATCSRKLVRMTKRSKESTREICKAAPIPSSDNQMVEMGKLTGGGRNGNVSWCQLAEDKLADGKTARTQASWCWPMGGIGSTPLCPKKETWSIMAFSYRPVLSRPHWQAHPKADAYRINRHSQDFSRRSQLYWSCCWKHRKGHCHWERLEVEAGLPLKQELLVTPSTTFKPNLSTIFKEAVESIKESECESQERELLIFDRVFLNRWKQCKLWQRKFFRVWSHRHLSSKSNARIHVKKPSLFFHRGGTRINGMDLSEST